MSDEYLLDLTHLHGALLQLVLSCLSTVEEPDISVEAQSERGVVARRGGLGRRAAQDGDVH